MSARRLMFAPTLAPTLALALAAAGLAGCASPGPAHTPPAARTLADVGVMGVMGVAGAPTAAQAAAGALTPAPAASAATPQPERLQPPWPDAEGAALVKQALVGQPSMALARARTARAAALAQVAGAAGQPQLGVQADVTHERFSEHGMMPPPIAGHAYTVGNVQLAGGWNLDLWGQHAAALAAAVGQQRAAQADAAAAANLLTGQVARSYIGVARLVAQQTVLAQMQATRAQIEHLAQARVAAGLDSRTESDAAAAARADARLQQAALAEQLGLARHQLAVLCGLAPDALDALAPRLDALTTPSAPQEATLGRLAQRAELVAARWRVQAAAHDEAAARAQFYPDINLSAFVGFNAIGLDQLFSRGSLQWAIAPALRLPLFEGGKLRGQLGVRQADWDAAVAQYDGALLDAVRQARDALASTQAVGAQQREQASAEAAARQMQALARERRDAGLVPQPTALAADLPVQAQARQRIDLQARMLDARIALGQALGDFTPALE